VLVFVPILFPLVEAMKFDLVWFCTLVAINLQTAYLSPVSWPSSSSLRSPCGSPTSSSAREQSEV